MRTKSLVFACLSIFFIGFAVSSNATTLFQCTDKNGASVFSDQPCNTDYNRVHITESGIYKKNQPKKQKKKNLKYIKSSNQQHLVGKWKKKGFIYHIKKNGTVRAEKYADNTVIGWKQGTWKVRYAKLEMSFAENSGKPLTATERREWIKGIVRWGKAKNEFSIRDKHNKIKHFTRIHDNKAQQNNQTASL